MTKSNMFLSLAGVLLLVAIALGFGWLWWLSGERGTRVAADDVTTRLMQRKLTATLEIRAGLAGKDLTHAQRGVAELQRIGEASAWYLPDPRYGHLSAEFRKALEHLGAVLAEQDTEQLPAAYTALTAMCVACHQQATLSPIDAAPLQLAPD
ncbi:MAG: hypothetical protein ACYC3X_14640 [Pirellulaceae bacterium]